MNEGKTSKIRLIKILEILRQETDEEHYMESSELIQKLKKAGIPVDRRTLTKDIELLNEFGYEIFVEKTTGFATKYGIADRLFDLPEVHILLDSVQSAAFVTEEKTKVLVDKIASLSGRQQGDILKENIVEFSTPKSKNERIFYLVNEITQAIINRRKIKFNYFHYDIDYQKKYKINAKGNIQGYKLNPLGTILDNGFYYLFTYDSYYKKVVTYRIDRMDNLELLDEGMDDAAVVEMENISARKRQLFSMYDGEMATVEFECDERIIHAIYDRFGDLVKLQRTENGKVGFNADVRVSPPFIAWCCTFGNQLKVKSPSHVIEDIQRHLKSTESLYDE